MNKTKRRRASRRKPPPVTIPAYNGDHGPNTQAARAGKELRPIEDENGKNPNNLARLQAVQVIDTLGLTMRQLQAANAITNAYCRNAMLSSGGALREQVDSSPKPDAVVAAQVDARSRLVHVMKPIPRGSRHIVEHICWDNKPGRTSGVVRWQALFIAAMDAVADHLGY